MGINSLITYIFASRERPEKFFDCLDNIDKLSISSNYEIIAVLDIDDLSMNNSSVKNRMLNYKNVKSFYGISKGKIHAINRELSKMNPETKIIINLSDDFLFLLKGFDMQIRNDMARYFPDTDGLLHYPDGTPNERRLMTMSIIGKKYFDRTGYIYNPDYASWYSDDEEIQKARILGKCKFVNERLFKHNHYLFNGSGKDELYKRNDDIKIISKDRETFFKRKQINFGL